MNRFYRLACFLSILSCGIFSGFNTSHEGPDPIAHWIFSGTSIQNETLTARLGPNATIDGKLSVTGDATNQVAHFDGQTIAVVADDFRKLNEALLPKKEMTISSWFSVEEGKQWGGIASIVQDNGSSESGWVLGYNFNRFYFALATTGADDGDGLMTYLESESRFEKGKLYHIVATYDGQTMQLIVNGKLESESTAQSGDILYPKSAPFVIGGYKDINEDHRHVGRIRDLAIYDNAAKPEWAAKEFAHNSKLAELPPAGVKPVEFEFSVKPYLQLVTQNQITVMWETTRPAKSAVQFGETAEVKKKLNSETNNYVHEVTLTNLAPETQYFYQAKSTDDMGKAIESEVLTFQTANRRETPFSFAIISDTQSNPKVSGQVAEMAWNQRPNFVLHPGDLVGTGTDDSHWKNQFFPSMNPLISRVAFFPVLGNHEVNARNYYDYMSLPKPEYFYKFSYGNTEFFMLDTNKNVGPESEQYQWVDKALSESKADWKIVCHHHPAYSSDENDYGNLWKTNKSTRGDARVRKLTPLYDKHNVDIVWSGHIHSYERTWAIRNNQVVAEGKGPMYMITGGGGGSLETAGPFKPDFQNNVRRGHHYCMVSINRGTLEFKAFDIENRLFDYLKLEKKLGPDTIR